MLMLIVTMAIAAGRIAVVASSDGLVPFLSANDRSRWCTIAALVEDGRYEIDRLQAITMFDPRLKREVRPWQTIDRVKHVGRDGIYHDYSSKPPLLPTMMAAVYAVWYWGTGVSLTEHPLLVGRLLLACINLPLLWFLIAPVQALIVRHSRSPGGAIFSGASICFATLLLPFTITLNNHLPAASATALTMWILLDEQRVGRWTWMLVAGLAAGMIAANELPGLALLGLLCLMAGALNLRLTATAFLPGVAIVGAGFFVTNWLAHESLRPPYAHRGIGPLLATLPRDTQGPSVPIAPPIQAALVEAGEPLEGPTLILGSKTPGRWMFLTQSGHQRYAVIRTHSHWRIHAWDDWYEYEGSYWVSDRRTGVDAGESSRWRYLLHMTLGHHGLFSLTPIWFLSVLGVFCWLQSASRPQRMMVAAIVVASLVCFGFYLSRPLIDRNYGGVSAGLRWMLWFSPAWVWLLIPAADYGSKRPLVWKICLTMLAISIFSAATVLENPWQHPWLYRIGHDLGWLQNR